LTWKTHIKFFADSTLNSYSEVFFAKNRVFAVLLFAITFFDPFVGLCGIVSVITTNLFAYILGFSKENIASGSYGFNSMLVGLGLGFYYGPNFPFFALLLVGALATLLATVTVAGILQKYNLPYLSVPFLLSLWAIMLASRNFEALEISERGIFKLNELYATGSGLLVSMYRGLKQLPIPELLKIYFNSLGAILFQFNLLAGIIIAIGLVIYSRIAFSISLISFIGAYYFYQLLGADIRTL
jgi:urea transporter